MPLSLTVVTAQRTVLVQEGVTRLIVPTQEGQITVLPSHAALMSALAEGEMIVRWNGGEDAIAIHGGFMQVLHDDVNVLADAAERVERIDVARAEAARARAEARLTGRETLQGGLNVLRAQLALQRALTRLRVARRRSSPTGAPSSRP